MKTDDRVILKPKDRGLSFITEVGQNAYDVTGSNGEKVVVIARSREGAIDLAAKHFGLGKFKFNK